MYTLASGGELCELRLLSPLRFLCKLDGDSVDSPRYDPIVEFDVFVSFYDLIFVECVFKQLNQWKCIINRR